MSYGGTLTFVLFKKGIVDSITVWNLKGHFNYFMSYMKAMHRLSKPKWILSAAKEFRRFLVTLYIPSAIILIASKFYKVAFFSKHSTV